MESGNRIAVAIDGPSGAGKSTVARAVAQQLGYRYVDTGAMYRAIGLYALRQGVSPEDAQGVTQLLPQITLDIRYQDGQQRILLGQEDVSEAIRGPQPSMAASQVSAIEAVRQHLLQLQRSFAEKYDVVMDGRDIATVVLPQAQVKIFLTASVEERAKRRYREDVAKQLDVSYNDTLKDIQQRDYNDSHRAIAPLRQAQDAVLVDSSGLTLQQTVQAILQIVKDCSQ